MNKSTRTFPPKTKNTIPQLTPKQNLPTLSPLTPQAMKFKRPDSPVVVVEMKNCGQTPAVDVRQWIHIWIEDWPLEETLPEPPPNFQVSTATLHPGGVNTMSRTKIPPVSSEAIKLLGTPEATIYVYRSEERRVGKECRSRRAR